MPKKLLKMYTFLASNRLSLFFLLPTSLFLAFLFIFQQHYFINFNTAFNLDIGDGYQNVWNIWWVNHSVAQIHQNPYFTTMLDWPHGITLIPQTMNIYNGLIGIILMNLFGMSLIQAVNFAVISAFVMSGVFMMWFVYDRVKNYKIALLAGFLFTFSSYHFAHAQGHLQLTSFQFVPLFLLFFWRLVDSLDIKYVLLSVASLFLVMLCDYYYLLWCVVLGFLYFTYKFLQNKQKYINKKSFVAIGAFVILASISLLPLLLKLSHLAKSGQLTGSHDPQLFSLDPLTIIIPGGSTALGQLLAQSYWTKLPYMSEMSVYFGLPVLTLICFSIYNIIKQRKTSKNVKKFILETKYWWVIMIMFMILAIGPRLRIYKETLDSIPMPYAWLELAWPTLQVSGMPVRWIFISHLAALIISSYTLVYLVQKKYFKNQAVVFIVLLVIIVDILPTQLPQATASAKKYVYVLRDLPRGAVIDNAAKSSSEQLFHQTIHEKPMAFGYTTRSTKQVEEKNFHIFADLEQGRHDAIWCKYKIRYVTTPLHQKINTKKSTIYQDSTSIIYDFSKETVCR